jgi:hypothetical protein
MEKLQPAEQQANRKQTIFEVIGEICQKLIWLTLNVNILILELKNIFNFLGDFSPFLFFIPYLLKKWKLLKKSHLEII